MGIDELDDELADDILDAAKGQDPPKSVKWFAEQFDIGPKETQRYLTAWIDGGWMKPVQDSDGTWLFVGEDVGNSPFNTADNVLRDINQVILGAELTSPKPVSWFAEKADTAHWKAHWALKELKKTGSVTEHTLDDVPVYSPPHVEAVSDTPQLYHTRHDTTKLVFPNGDAHEATVTTVGDCTVASASSRHAAAVFVDDEFSFLIDEDAPISRVAIGKNGHVAYHSGEHRESVFHITTWTGEHLLEERVEVARSPVFTPDGDHVAYWRLADHTVYIYNTATRSVSGEFDTTNIRRTNIGLHGVTRNDRPAFQITDTYGPGDDEVLGHISPTGELLDTDPTPASNRTEQAAPSDDAILDEIMDEFEHGL